MMLNWWDIFEARFGKKLDEKDIAVWENEISNDIHGLKDGEVARAVRSLAERDRKDGAKRRYAPDVEEIITQIIRCKYEDKEAQELPAGECGLCHDGWVSFGMVADRNGPDRIKGVDGFVVRAGAVNAMTCATFCRCPRGKAHRDLAIKSGRTDGNRAKTLTDLVFKAIKGET